MSKVALVGLLNSKITFQFPRCTTAKSPKAECRFSSQMIPNCSCIKLLYIYKENIAFQLRHNKPLLLDLLLSLCVWFDDFKSLHITVATALASLHDAGPHIMGINLLRNISAMYNRTIFLTYFCLVLLFFILILNIYYSYYECYFFSKKTSGKQTAF